jgi:flagellar biosynthesis/type III secretory pathway protein FliH
MSCHLKEPLIMKDHRELEPDHAHWPRWPSERERASFMFLCGEQTGRLAGRQEGRRAGWQQGRREGRQEGRLEGRALAVLDVLRIRGVEVDAESEARILACRDSEQLLAWLTRATTLARVDELFESP